MARGNSTTTRRGGRKNETENTETTETTSGFSFADVEVGAVDALPKGVSVRSENPLTKHVEEAKDNGPRYIPVPNGDAARQAENYLRRAAQELGCGINIRFTDAEDKPQPSEEAKAATNDNAVFVYFQVNSERRTRESSERRYTVKDIREHFGLGDKEKVTQEHRAQYRADKGFDQRER